MLFFFFNIQTTLRDFLVWRQNLKTVFYFEEYFFLSTLYLNGVTYTYNYSDRVCANEHTGKRWPLSVWQQTMALTLSSNDP